MSNLGKRLVVYVTFIALVVTMCAVPQVKADNGNWVNIQTGVLGGMAFAIAIDPANSNCATI